MANKKGKALSWTASLIIHATGLVMILVAGFHIAVPEGSVTDKVEFQAVDSKPVQTSAPQPPTPKVKAQAATQEKSEPPQSEEKPAPPVEDEAPPLETQNQTEAPMAPEESTAQNDPTAPPAVEPESSPAAEESAEPPQTPVEAAAPAPGPTQAGASIDTAAGSALQEGATIDESKLNEAFGNHKPRYPYMARLRKQQGTVILKAFVDPNGSVSQVTISESSGFPQIDEEARTTYERWRYQPGLTGWVFKPFKFSLK